MALREAEWGGKAYNANLVCLYLLRICSQDTRVFVFDPARSDKGHEKEVLFASGTRLIFRAERVVRTNYTVHQVTHDLRTKSKPVTFSICEVDVY